MGLLTGCAAETAEADVADANMEIESKDFKPVSAPKGMPAVWAQPDSRGWFGEKGMCGPTAVANTLRLLGMEKSPTSIYEEGAHSLIGLTPNAMEAYMTKHYASLGCDAETVDTGKPLLLRLLRAKRPVNVLLSGLDGVNAHWVTVVGARSPKAKTVFTVMSWGRYYEIDEDVLLRSWDALTNSAHLSCKPVSTFPIGVVE